MKNIYFSPNIKLLRKRMGRTQEEVAFALGINRSTLNGYEHNVGKPNMKTLLAFSDYYSISLDTLLKVDLSNLSGSQLTELENGFDVYIRGGRIRVLATAVDSENEETIELVPEKAHAGYTRGFADTEYIRALQRFQLPFLSKNKKYRAFQISGDSMLPIPEGSWVIGEFLENWYSVKDGDACVILTIDDGIVFKLVENRIKKDKMLRLHSLNPLYEPFSIIAVDIKEIWKFVNYISSEMPEPELQEAELHKTVANLKKDVEIIKKRFS